MYSLSTWSCPSSSQAQIPGERRPGQGWSRLGGADPEGAAGGLDAAAASGTIEAEDDGLAPHSSPGCRLTRLDWWYCYGWDGAGVPGGRPNAEPGAGSAGPIVDRVVSGWGDDYGVGRAGSGFAGLAVLAADWAAGLGLDGGHVYEVQRGGSGYDLDCPAVFLGQLDELADFRTGACAADDDGKDAAVLGHSVTPMRRAKSSAWRWTLSGAVVIRSRTRRRAAGRPPSRAFPRHASRAARRPHTYAAGFAKQPRPC